MSLEVSKPGDSYNSKTKPKLSKFGKAVVAALVVIFIAIIVIITSSVNNGRKTASAEAAVLTEISRAVSVCKNTMTAIKKDSTVILEYEKKINESKKIADKINISGEMIGYALSQVENDRALTDELNGVRNRIFVAQKELK